MQADSIRPVHSVRIQRRYAILLSTPAAIEQISHTALEIIGMEQSSKIVRFGFALIAMLLVTGLVYAGNETPESELSSLVTQLTKIAQG